MRSDDSDSTARPPVSTTRREFEFQAADFERIRDLIHAHAGIVLSPSKQDMVYGRLSRRLRERGLRRFSDYIELVRRDRGEWQAFVNALTTNLTSFFREAHHFGFLAERLRAFPGGRPFAIWCCAASTGEEPYSLAITACEAFDSLRPPVSIVATDLNTSVLAEARRGIYPVERVEALSAEQRSRYFMAAPDSPGSVRVRPELQQLIRFETLNLLDQVWTARGPFDAIFCRNVMIYFDKPTQYRILERFLPLLRPDGLLFAGHSESFLHAANLFLPLGRTVYQRQG